MKNTATPDQIMGSWIDRRPWRWWDRGPFRTNYELTFFQLGMNQIDPLTKTHKTPRDTNMMSAGQFSPPYCHMVYQIGFQIDGSDEAVDAFYTACYFELRIMQKIFAEGPLFRFKPGSGFINLKTGEPNPLKINIPEPKTPSPDDQKWMDGFPVPQAGVRFIEPIYIPPLTYFALKLQFPNGIPDPTLEVCAYLDGLTDLPVQ